MSPSAYFEEHTQKWCRFGLLVCWKRIPVWLLRSNVTMSDAQQISSTTKHPQHFPGIFFQVALRNGQRSTWPRPLPSPLHNNFCPSETIAESTCTNRPGHPATYIIEFEHDASRVPSLLLLGCRHRPLRDIVFFLFCLGRRSDGHHLRGACFLADRPTDRRFRIDHQGLRLHVWWGGYCVRNPWDAVKILQLHAFSLQHVWRVSD